VRNILKHITLLLVSGLFFISATGIYFTVHHCTSENFTLLFLFSPVDGYCDHQNTGHRGSSSSGDACDTGCEQDANGHDSCTAPVAHGCCSDTVLYVDVDDDFVKTEQPGGIQASNVILQPAFGFDIVNALSTDEIFHPCGNSLPPGRHGKLLVLCNRQLLL
jgi:hypothetical protein